MPSIFNYKAERKNMLFQDENKLNWIVKDIVIIRSWPEKFISDKQRLDCQSFIGLLHMCNAN